MACRPSVIYPVFIKFYWDTATFIYLCIIYDCFHTTMAELNSFNRSYMHQKLKVLTSFFLKSLSTPSLSQTKTFPSSIF